MSPEENKRANILCVISLACEVGPMFLNGILSALLTVNGVWNVGDAQAFMENIGGVLSGLLFIAGIVLLIIVRVKYPKNVFGKVLMWVYIVIGVIMLLLMIAAMVFLMVACNACFQELQNCPGFLF